MNRGSRVANKSRTKDSHVSIPVDDCCTCKLSGLPAFHSATCNHLASPSLLPVNPDPSTTPTTEAILNPRSKRVKSWNRAAICFRATALVVDMIFVHAVFVDDTGPPWVRFDPSVACMVVIARTCLDTAHAVDIWLQFRLPYVLRESLVVGCGELVWDARAIAEHYLRSIRGFWFDVYVILPIPQMLVLFVWPWLIERSRIRELTKILFLLLVFQFLPRVYNTFYMMRRMQKVTGYIFGSVWWGFYMNIIAYLFVAHVVGGIWYVLSTQSVVTCIQKTAAAAGKSSSSVVSSCFDCDGPYVYGIYRELLPVIAGGHLSIRVFYPIYWGLLNLSSLANELEPSTNWVELTLGIGIVTGGLMLFTISVSNIQIFLGAILSSKKRRLIRFRDIEWWMRRRQLPFQLRKRVLDFEKQRWKTIGGEDEMELIKDLPDGLRRDIKHFLCLDLVKKVPLFHDLDDLILENICDRVKPLLYSKGEKVIREGDPVHRMVFIVHGLVTRSQNLRKGKIGADVLHPGGFLGDELLSWCLRRPFNAHLPTSSATFVCTDHTQAFCLDWKDLRYVTEHFRYRFSSERMRWTVRYFSSNWRTWAAVNVQFAWRRHRTRANGGTIIPVADDGGDAEHNRLRHYAVMFMSLRPHDTSIEPTFNLQKETRDR